VISIRSINNAPRKNRQRWATARWEFGTNAERASRAVESNAAKPFPNAYTRWKGFKKKKNGFRIDSLKPTKIKWRLVFLFSISRKSFLWKIVTGNEKWILYDNPKRKKYEQIPANPQHRSQSSNASERWFCSAFGGISRAWFIMSCWNWVKQLLRWLVPTSINLPWARNWNENARILCKGERPVKLLRDNVRPHVASKTKDIIMNLGWDVLAFARYNRFFGSLVPIDATRFVRYALPKVAWRLHRPKAFFRDEI